MNFPTHTIWGQVGITNRIIIEENVAIFTKSGVTKSLLPNAQYFGLPSEEYCEKLREIAFVRKLKAYFKKKNI